MNFHDRGNGDITVARMILSPTGNPTNDESVYDIAAYHVQQGIEKELKYILHDILGEDENSNSFKTHNITDLIGQVESHGIDVPDEIVDLAYDLKEWEAATRYSHSSVAKTEEIKEAIDAYERFADHVKDFIEPQFSDIDIEAEDMDKISVEEDESDSDYGSID